MDYLLIFLAGLALGWFSSIVLFGLMFAHPAQSWTPAVRREPPPMPSVVPVEQGNVSYEFINLTGLEE